MTRDVVFVHGMWSQASAWDAWLPAFTQRGYTCHAVTLPGHRVETSDAELARVGFAECVQAVADVVARLERPILIGHSMGGLIAQKVAETTPLSATVLINSAAPRAVFPLRPVMLPGLARHFVSWGLWKDVLRLSPREADYLLFSGLDQTARERCRASLLPESGRIAYQVGFGRVGWSRVHEVDPARIVCPMLALAGVQDHMIPIGVSRAMARLYGPRLTYRELPNNAHWLLGEPGYLRCIDDVLTWLHEHGARTEQAAPVAASECGR